MDCFFTFLNKKYLNGEPLGVVFTFKSTRNGCDKIFEHTICRIEEIGECSRSSNGLVWEYGISMRYHTIDGWFDIQEYKGDGTDVSEDQHLCSGVNIDCWLGSTFSSLCISSLRDVWNEEAKRIEKVYGKK